MKEYLDQTLLVFFIFAIKPDIDWKFLKKCSGKGKNFFFWGGGVIWVWLFFYIFKCIETFFWVRLYFTRDRFAAGWLCGWNLLPMWFLRCTAKTQYRKFETNIPRNGIASLSPNLHIHESVSHLYIIPRPVCLFCYKKICGPILEIYT